MRVVFISDTHDLHQRIKEKATTMMGKRERKGNAVSQSWGRIQRALENNERWHDKYEAIRTLETLKRNLEVEQAEEEEHWF